MDEKIRKINDDALNDKSPHDVFLDELHTFNSALDRYANETKKYLKHLKTERENIDRKDEKDQ